MSMSSSSSSSSSSFSSSPSPSSMFASQTPRRRALEDVWKDITPSSTTTTTTTTTPHHRYHLHRHHPQLHHVMMRPPSSSTPSELQPYHHHTTTTTATTTSTSKGAIILQDLLAGTLNRPLPAPPAEGLRLLPLPPALSLNSPGLDFSNSRRTDPRPDADAAAAAAAAAGGGCAVCSSYASPGFSSADSPPNIFSLCAKKRAPDSPGRNGCGSGGGGGGGGGGDRRHKRMIKNRESAARSRARRQAYTNGLELEVAHLLEENAKLKKEQEELRLALAAHLPTKNALQRSSSSPF